MSPDGTYVPTLIDKKFFCDLVTQIDMSFEDYANFLVRASIYYPAYFTMDEDGNIEPKSKIPGQLVTSLAFPSDLCYKRKTETHEEYPYCEIRDGIIIPSSGPVCKKIIGPGCGTTVHLVWKYYSPRTCTSMVTGLQKIAAMFLPRWGFSMGISDCLPISLTKVNTAIALAMAKCEIVNASAKDDEEKEREVNGILNGVMGVAPELAKTSMNKGDRNGLVVMCKAGAKGSTVNNGQIAAFVGQQNIDGQQMEKTLSDGTRTLPHYMRGDNSPEARGFVSNSFLKGLNYKEAFFHARGGRRGVIDTAMKSVTGESRIMIEEGGVIKIIEIGPWIDNLITNNIVKVDIYKERNMELLLLDQAVKIPSTDMDGNMEWSEVTAITRHDPGEFLYKIETKSGRKVIVTESKSLLIWDEDQASFVQTNGDKAKIGDYVPVTYKLPNNTKVLVCGLNGYRKHNDVILDPIVSIEKISGTLYPHVYDLTVPSTTNFSLANGLNVADTSDSGYVSKQIQKKLENNKTRSDGCVVDEKNNIIQYLFGGDGLNPKKLVPCKNLEYPFFINPEMQAEIINSRALQKAKKTKTVNELGELRTLTNEEITTLISFVKAGCPGVQTEVTEMATYNVRIALRCALAGVKLYEKKIPKFCRTVCDIYEQSKTDHGEMVGLIAGCSIGELSTQLTLNVFHNAGNSAKDVTLGVPRFKELLYASKNPSKSSCTIHVDDETLTEKLERYTVVKELIKKSEEDKAQKMVELGKIELEMLETASLSRLFEIGDQYVNLKVKDILIDSELRYLPIEVGQMRPANPIGLITYEEYQPSWWVTLAKSFGKETQIQASAWIIILKLDVNKLYRYSIDIETVAEKIEEEAFSDKGLLMSCVASPNSIGEIEVYLNFSDIKEYVATKIELPLGENPSDRCLINTDNIDFYTAREVALEFICKIHLSGTEGVTKIYPQSLSNIIDTQGSNFLDVLITPGVNAKKTTCDDVWEIYKILGVEAARKFLIKETTKIVSFDGSFVNPHHIELLVDAMTRTGVITSVNRNGIGKEASVLAQCMFEKTVDNFAQSAAFTCMDDGEGVAASVMFGTTAKAGTGMVEIKDIDTLPARRENKVSLKSRSRVHP
jgi:DNA-directed RNA polymerase beta' subunit